MSEVIYYTSDEAGAPALVSTTAGSLIGVLDACLVNGFNSKTVTSIVVAGGIATVTCSAHGYLAGRKVLQAGATTRTGLNGNKLVLTVPTSNTYTFDATGVTDGTESTGLTAKRAPLGWTKSYSGTNLAIYARTDLAATAMMLRIDDTSASSGAVRVVSVESASDVNTYVGAAPTTAQNSGGQFWHKGASSGTSNWTLVGDGRTFYFFPVSITGAAATDSTSGCAPFGFGDITSFRASDAYCSFLAGATSNGATANALYSPCAASASFTSALVLQRSFTQVGTAVQVAIPGSGTSVLSMMGSVRPIFPSAVDNGLVVNDRVLLIEQNSPMGNPFRGYLRGLKEPMGFLPDSMHRGILSNVYGSSRSYIAIRLYSAGNSSVGCVLLDVSGPWD